jgi:hypothetical protein
VHRLNLVALAILVSGCTMSPSPSYLPSLPANLAVDCDKLPPLKDTKASTVFMWTLDSVNINHRCALLHSDTVKFYNTVRGKSK